MRDVSDCAFFADKVRRLFDRQIFVEYAIQPLDFRLVALQGVGIRVRGVAVEVVCLTLPALC